MFKREKVVCPYCQGDAREIYPLYIKVMYFLLIFAPKYQCRQCKKKFNEIDVKRTYDNTNK